tara:strand:+ start:291 stop:665 length:375 start_codon:yes stop_codon:yes gene_type:complete
MALGNSMSIGKARGKGRAVLVKRKKQVDLAKHFHVISGSLITGGPACNVSNSAVTETYYHDATNATIGASGGCQVGTFVYTLKRDHEDFYLPDGIYKITQNGSDYYGIQMQDGRIKSGGLEACK